MLKKRLGKLVLWLLSSVAVIFSVITILLWVYKDEIVGMAVDQANKYLKVKVNVSEVDLTFWGSFPNLSVDFNQVFIQDALPGSTMYDTLLYTDRVRCKFDPLDIWNEKYEIKEIEISPGTLQLKVDSIGNTNYDIFASSDSTAKQEEMDFKLERLYVKGLRFTYANAISEQFYGTSIDQLGATGDFTKRKFTAKTISNFDIIEARTGSIALVRDQAARLNLGVEVDLDSATVSIPASTIYISDLPFNFNAELDSTGYEFHLDGKQLKLDDVANKLAPERTREIRKYSGSGDVQFELDVHGKNDDPGGANIACAFGVSDGSLSEPVSKMKLNNLLVEGKYTKSNKPGNELLELAKVKFQSQMGLFSGKLSIKNFLRPLYRVEADGAVDLGILNQFFTTSFLDELRGHANVGVQCIVQQDKDAAGRDRFDVVRLAGSMELNKARLKLIDDKRTFRNITGSLYLKNDQIGLQNLRVNLLDSDLRLDGFFSGIQDFINGRAPIQTEVNINANKIRIADLSSSDKTEKQVGSRSFILPNTLKGKVVMKIGDLEYEGHHFRLCEGEVTMRERYFQLDRFHFTNAGSRISGKVSVLENKPEILELSCNLVSNSIGIDQLFKEWKNFDQDVITYENISGTAQLNLQLYAPFDYRNGVISNSIEALAALRIQDGRLKNVSAFNEIVESINSSTAAKLAIGNENIKSFSSKLKDLRFQTLENTITIRNSIISIPNMSVQSSALDVEVSGKHHFNNDIDYRFGFRFRDLKQKKESEFGEIVDDGTGKFIFLRMYGNIEDPTIEWDKETNREKRQEKIEQEKQDAKSILKTEFGLFKNDSTVKTYVEEKRPREEIKVSFDALEANDSIIRQKTKKDSKLNRMLDKWKTESEADKKEEFTIDQD